MQVTGSRPLDRLLRLLDLEQLDRDLFLGDPGKGEGRLFGGMVAAQSVVAAHRTVEAGHLHSLHAYFIRPGRHDVPIRFVVYRIRDGRTFTTRDVTAYQAGEAIFGLSCSFALPEEGMSHQEPAPEAPGPEHLPDWELVRPDREEDRAQVERWMRASPIEIRGREPERDVSPEQTPRRQVWLRVKGVLPEDPMVHAAMLTYASDRGLISTARQWHGITMDRGAAASLDHAIWFHHVPRWDGWILYTSESPIAHNARALIHGRMYREDGTLIASVAQEGLIRIPRKRQ
jgi:acyl-CoA thioesterase-2